MARRRAPRVALVGCGHLSTRMYLPTLEAAHRAGLCRFEALCDLDARLLAARARRFGVKRTYTDIGALLDGEDLDGIFLVVPVSATPRLAALTLSRGVPTYLEKPPGRSARECARLARIAAAGGVPNQVAFNRRYAPPLAAMRRKMLRYGPIHSASAVMFRCRRLEATFPWATAVHAIDALRSLAGDFSLLRTRKVHLPGSGTASFIVDIDYESGGAGTLEVLPDTGVRMERYVAHGADCTGLAQVAGPGSCVDYPGSVQVYRRGKAAALPAPFGRRRKVSPAEACGFRDEILAFLQCLRSGRRPAPGLEESIQSMQAAEAVAAGRSYRKRT